MRKIYGANERQDGLYRIGREKWELVYGFGKDRENDETGYNFRQRFSHKPTAEECVEIVREAINCKTQERILRDLRWKGMQIWLSKDNQLNYKTAYDLAVESLGGPVRFKFGTDEAPQYHEFADLEELRDFHLAWTSHIAASLADGWAEKDAVDPKMFEV